jgi:hypothetical protein
MKRYVIGRNTSGNPVVIIEKQDGWYVHCGFLRKEGPFDTEAEAVDYGQSDVCGD